MSLDYYHILQVDPRAEQEVIEAAYRRLVRKYHPDVLDAAQRDDPDTLRRIQEINEAYAVLGDVHSRTRYDEERRSQIDVPTDSSGQQIKIEKRVYPARCASTKQTFKILLARKEGSSELFRVVGYEPLNEPALPMLPVTSQSDLLGGLFGKLFYHRTISSPPIEAGFPSEQELKAMFDESVILDFGHIDWAGFICPACAGEYIHPDGTLSTWGLCGKCSRLYCLGGSVRTSVGGFTICPWCGAKRQLTHHVSTGTQARKFVRGRLDFRHSKSSENILMKTQSKKGKKQLPPSGSKG